VDTQGLLTTVLYSAAIQDRVAARAVLTRQFCRFDTIPTVFVDGVYKPRFGRLSLPGFPAASARSVFRFPLENRSQARGLAS
jgi:hypothetical protein